MKSNFKLLLANALSFAILAGVPQLATAQDGPVTHVEAIEKGYLNWYNMHPSKDKVQGAAVDQAYKDLLPDRKTKKTVVVAVIDSGTDINHQDLKEKIWVNTREIPGNGIDDDNNGYIDDVNGWNFLGNAEGENISYENYEFVRMLRKLSPKYGQVKSEREVAANDLEEYRTYLRCKTKYEEELPKQKQTLENLELFEKNFLACQTLISNHLQKDTFSLAELKQVKSNDELVMRAKNWLVSRYNQGLTLKGLTDYKEHVQAQVDKYLNLAFIPREILGDNDEDINDRNYGNNQVTGPKPDHGTSVAGIIAGVRNNGVGIDGIAQDVQIMVLRTVPDGDENDKDVALAIRYAVDNGANIINMSFGKTFSPQRHMVDEAVKYAEAHNVLLVHSAGNDATNIDEVVHYPAKIRTDGSKASSWLEVGASSMKLDKNFCASFSNYGKGTVDLFAPGVDVVSLWPEDKYSRVDGTSFSGPVVSGVAALVWSYYPELSAAELKEVLVKSCTVYKNHKVLAPTKESEKKSKVKFGTLSETGGIVNAYEALKLADKMVSKKTAQL